jgi:alpha-1,2-mannosyltransferase
LVILPALAAALYGWAVCASTFNHPGSIGFNYIAPGTDWMVLYGAIRLAVAHQFALTNDGMAFTAYLNTSFGDWLSKPLFYRPWVYPPSLLVVLLPFSVLGFVGSYLAFQLTSAALLAGALLFRAERSWAAPFIALAALTCPSASINVIDGQGGFFVACVMVLGIRLLSCRPLLAGAVLGLLSVKPQFALLLPVPLLMTGHWRGLLGAAGSALGLVAVSAMIFGLEPWIWWLHQMAASNSDSTAAWVTFGRLWGNSVYACAVLLGSSPRIGSLLQMLAVLGAAASVFVAFRFRYGTDRRLSILLAATILAAPHSGSYDAILLTIAGGLWFADHPAPQLRHGIVLLVLWLSPMIGPPAVVPIGRFMPLLVAGFIVLAVIPGGGGLRPTQRPTLRV